MLGRPLRLCVCADFCSPGEARPRLLWASACPWAQPLQVRVRISLEAIHECTSHQQSWAGEWSPWDLGPRWGRTPLDSGGGIQVIMCTDPSATGPGMDRCVPSEATSPVLYFKGA